MPRPAQNVLGSLCWLKARLGMKESDYRWDEVYPGISAQIAIYNMPTHNNMGFEDRLLQVQPLSIHFRGLFSPGSIRFTLHNVTLIELGP